MKGRDHTRGMWPLTKRECEAMDPPHRRQRVIVERSGVTQYCELCGTTLERPARRPQRKKAA